LWAVSSSKPSCNMLQLLQWVLAQSSYLNGNRFKFELVVKFCSTRNCSTHFPYPKFTQ
jgi:hypothetical protein